MSYETAVTSACHQLLQQLTRERPSLTFMGEELFAGGGPAPRSLIAVTGTANTGKSLLMWEFMSRCLPPTYFGGKYCDIVFIDLGHKFDVNYFIKNIGRVICKSGENFTTAEFDAVVQKCLESVTTFSCFSSQEFEIALDKVEDILLENHNVALLAIDNLNAFYWLDGCHKQVRMQTYCDQITKRLKKLCETHNICCIYTADHAANKDKEAGLLCERPPNVDYQISLELLPDGSRKLNGKPISIDNDGIHFTMS